jgi:hypothetical protein
MDQRRCSVRTRTVATCCGMSWTSTTGELPGQHHCRCSALADRAADHTGGVRTGELCRTRFHCTINGVWDARPGGGYKHGGLGPATSRGGCRSVLCEALDATPWLRLRPTVGHDLITSTDRLGGRASEIHLCAMKSDRAMTRSMAPANIAVGDRPGLDGVPSVPGSVLHP